MRRRRSLDFGHDHRRQHRAVLLFLADPHESGDLRLAEMPDAELFFITGADALADIFTWRDAEELFRVTEQGLAFFGDRFAITSSMGDAVLAHLAKSDSTPVTPNCHSKRNQM